jgi:hypothetical protein
MKASGAPQPQRSRGARVLVRLYPPAWRERYADEYVALLEDTGVTAGALASTLRGAIDAWLRPSSAVLAGSARLRASVSTVWCVWVAVVGLAGVMAQLTSDRPFKAAQAAHPFLAGARIALIVGAAVSIVAILAAGVPLIWSLWRAAWEKRDLRAAALLALPAMAPPAWVVAAVVIARVVPQSRVAGVGVGAAWFVVIVALGVVAGAAGAVGPVAAMRRVGAGAGELRIAARGAGVLACAIGLIAISSVLYATALGADAPRIGSVVTGAGFLAPYAAAMALAFAAAALSAWRGRRALDGSAASP